MDTEQKQVVLPEAFLNRMKFLLQEEYEAFVQSYEAERVHGLRFNTLKGRLADLIRENEDRFGLQPVSWCKEGFYYDGGSRPGKHPFHEAGIYYIQEPSAMAVVELLDPQPGDVVLDLCAAPGGKTSQIAERLEQQGLLVSNEIHPARARILSQNAERMGIMNAVVTNEDSEKLEKFFPEFFDKIVVDAPCSGEGMFRKDAQARAEWSEVNVKLCADRQQMILEHAAGMLKPGGRMVYSTCTFAPEEDEEGIARFLERHPDFFIEKVTGREGLSQGHPEWSDISCDDLVHTFRIWPHRSRGEGHYLAVLGKQGSTRESGSKPEKKKKGTGISFWNDKAEKKMFRNFVKETFRWEPAEDQLVLFGEQLYQVPEQMPGLDGLRVLRPGLHLGTLKKNRIEPAHALALALRPEQVKQSLCLNSEGDEIWEYLRGNTLQESNRMAEGLVKGDLLKVEPLKGWVLVCVNGYSLGWAKAASGVLKNHYPKGLRIAAGSYCSY